MRAERKLPKTKSVIRVDEIVNFCRGKDVLNIGMGGYIDNADRSDAEITPDALLDSVHYRLSTVATHLVGTDIIQASLDKMNALLPGEYIWADVMAADFIGRFNRKFDVVVFGEVIEHLDNFQVALANIRGLLKPDGVMLLTTANAFAADRIAKMFMNYEAGHEEHTSYFSYLTIKRLLDMNDFEIRDFQFHTERPFRTATKARFALYYVLRGITAILPQFSEGIFVIAKPKSHAAAH